jgi:hypothetical protein
MKSRTPAIVAAMLCALAAPALSTAPAPVQGEEKLAEALEGRVAGKPVRCLSLHNIRSSEIIDGTAILYRTGANRLYVNRPEIGRESLDRDDILVTRTFGSQLCSIDTVQLIDRASRFYSGFVGLGEFVPYTKVAKPN